MSVELGPMRLVGIFYGVSFSSGEKFPRFGAPFFYKEGSGNQTFIQETDGQGVIRGFCAVDFGCPVDQMRDEELELIDRGIIRKAGDSGVFVFRPLGRRIMGSRGAVERRLRTEIDNLRSYPGFPFLLWEISGFLGDKELNKEAHRLILEDSAENYPGTTVKIDLDEEGMIKSVGYNPTHR